MYWKENLLTWEDNMKIKKTLAVLLASAMLALTACSEDTRGVPLTDDPVTTTTTTQATTTTTTRGTSAVTTAAAPKSSVNVDFKTYTYKMKDAQNYEYEITLTLSPWILDTQSEVLDSAWAKVGKGKNKPAINNMGAQKYANNVYTTQLSDSQGRNRTFYATMTNMYFSVGTVSVKNVTSGWDFSASKPGTPKIALNWVKNINQKSLVIENELLMTKTFYTSSENTDIGELYVKPKMTKNTWGPVTVVLAHAENISPKYPGGQYADYVKSGYLLADWAVNETKITIPVYTGSSSSGWLNNNGDNKTAATTKQTVSTISPSAKANDLGNGLFELGGHYYKAFNNPKKWDFNDSNAACQKMGGHLVSINSQAEQDLMVKITGTKDNYWIGLIRHGSTWRWIDSSEFGYTHWDRAGEEGGQPDNYGGRENVARIAGKTVKYDDWTMNKGGWLDTNALGEGEDLSTYGYICEWDSKPDMSKITEQ